MIPSDIKAISFDAGGTLIRPRPSVGHVYAHVARRHGWGELDHAELTNRFADSWKAKGTFNYTRPEWAALVARIFGGLVKHPDDPAFFDHLYRAFEQPEHWEIHRDVLLTLEGLAQSGYKLLVISNWDERLHSMLDSLGLAAHFSAVVVSLEVDCTKPDPGIFQKAAERMRLEPAQILHVGDSSEEDFKGAIEAGMSARLIDRESNGDERDTLTSLLELLPVEELQALPLKSMRPSRP